MGKYWDIHESLMTWNIFGYFWDIHKGHKGYIIYWDKQLNLIVPRDQEIPQ